ncbi:MAG: type II toxin-antitoxin system HipA family toxin [Sulfuricellaceae bacterium]
MAQEEAFLYKVYLTRTDGVTAPCGILAAAVKGNVRDQRVLSEFRYDAAYLQERRGFALDPYALPLQAATHAFSGGLPLVVEDALPDAWGRAIIARDYNLAPWDCHPASLLRYLRNPLGALSFAPMVRGRAARDLPDAPIPQLSDLAGVEQNIEEWEGRNLSREVIAAIRAGSSLGGARPKVLVQEGGCGWIAKFPSREDDFDVVRSEYVCLAIARASGLTVPEHRLIAVNAKPVLLVRRFDESASGRWHMASMKTLMTGRNVPSSYVGMSAVVRELSAAVAEDGVRLFRWMLVNVVVGNIDDHLKNFSMLRDDGGWLLSPAYDITPATLANEGYGGRDHSINFDSRNSPPGRDEVVQIGRDMGLTRHQVKESMTAVRDAVEGARGWLGEVLDARNAARFAQVLQRGVAGMGLGG